MTITRIEQQREHILDSDAAQARADAAAAVIARALDEAPVGYAELTAAARAGRAAALVAGLDAATVRLVAVRWMVERGGLWGWGDVDYLEAKLLRLARELAAELDAAAAEELPTIEDLAEAAAALDAYAPMPRPAPDAGDPAALISGPLAPTAEQLRAAIDDRAADAAAAGERAAARGDRAGVAHAAGQLKQLGRVRDAVTAAADAGQALAVRLDDGATLVRGGAWYEATADRCTCPHGQRARSGRCWHRRLVETLDGLADAAAGGGGAALAA